MRTFVAGGASMPKHNVVPLFTGRGSASRRRKARAAFGLAGAFALALAPLSVPAEGVRLPPGHPPVGSEQLPPGHPPLPGGDASACSPDLPQGHPPVRDLRVPEGHPPVELRPCGPGGAARGVAPAPRPLYFPDASVVET
jgi:hypothetical protein